MAQPAQRALNQIPRRPGYRTGLGSPSRRPGASRGFGMSGATQQVRGRAYILFRTVRNRPKTQGSALA